MARGAIVVRVRGQEGAALVVALAAASLVAATVLLLAVIVGSRRDTAAYDRRGMVLSELADGVIAETLAELADHPSFAGVTERRFGAGTIRSEVGIATSGMVVVTGVAAVNGWRCVIVVDVLMDGGPQVVRMTRRFLPPQPGAADASVVDEWPGRRGRRPRAGR